MRYFVLTLLLVLAFFSISNAQETDILQDTTTIVKASVLDSAFFKKDIFLILQERGPYSNRVNVEQTPNLLTAFYNHVAQASNKRITGYRVRIFFDNKQDARVHSSNVEAAFSASHPEIPVYRTHISPFFKVTVGDFRTKSEAMMLLKRIEYEFPSAFLVKETINFPPL
ncbi:MAG: hypothetical protein ABFC28_02095 [Rikenellaceae bacterium]